MSPNMPLHTSEKPDGPVSKTTVPGQSDWLSERLGNWRKDRKEALPCHSLTDLPVLALSFAASRILTTRTLFSSEARSVGVRSIFPRTTALR